MVTRNSFTRMHSSRMRTARLLTVSQHALPGGVPAQGGVLAREGGGGPAQGDGPARGRGAPAQVLPPCEQNDRQVQKYYLAPNFVCGR